MRDLTSARRSFREFYNPRRHTVLLIAIIAFIGLFPLAGTGQLARILLSVALVTLLVAALYAIQVDELLGEHDKLVAERRRRILAIHPGRRGRHRTRPGQFYLAILVARLVGIYMSNLKAAEKA